jgi:hypothetical protein
VVCQAPKTNRPDGTATPARPGSLSYVAVVAGGIAIVVILVLFPVIAVMGGAALAALLGTLLHRDGERRHADSELLDLNT